MTDELHRLVSLKMPNDPTWRPTHRHKKGGLYRVIAQGTFETDRSDVTIYDDKEGKIWVRPATEFYDGRFEPVSGED